MPVDAGRPWGWAVRAFMDDPTQPLYNTTKQKLLDGKQVTQSQHNNYAYFNVAKYNRQMTAAPTAKPGAPPRA